MRERGKGGSTRVNGVEEVSALFLFLDVGVDEERVHFRVDVFHHDLESVKAACFWYLDFSTESLDEVLIDDPVRGSEESKDVGHEVFLVVIQAVIPVVKIL